MVESYNPFAISSENPEMKTANRGKQGAQFFDVDNANS
jgi:hypothetical protein